MKPYISIVMSIYNAVDTLCYSIESLVNQSLQNIEIILVDKESTDGSHEVVDMYALKFPDKIRAFHMGYSQSPSVGWNYGINTARADYIAFCDADDAFELDAMSVLYDIISQKSVDMVFFYTKILVNNKVIRIDKYTSNFTKSNLICCDLGMNAVWNKLWNKKLFSKTGKMIDTLTHDIVYCPSAISNAEVMIECKKALYIHSAEGGVSKGTNQLKFKSLFTGWDSLFQLNYNHDFENEVMTALAIRICIGAKIAPRFIDSIADWVKNHKEFFIDNPVLAKRTQVKKQIYRYIYDYECLIPKIVYLNGFGGNISDEWVKSIKEKSFNFSDGEIVILNEHNCDCSNSLLSEALEKQQFVFLGHYFALKKIKETGGFFLSSKIKMNISLNSLRTEIPAVFSFFDKKTYIDYFFGALADSKVIDSLLFTYENDFYDDKFIALSDRLLNILSAEYDIPICGKYVKKENVIVLPPTKTVFDMANGTNLFTVDLSDHLNQEGYSVIKNDFFEYTLKEPDNKYKKQLDTILKTDSYKFANRLKKFGNTKLGYFPKKIFKFFLRIYRKRKYGMG